MKRIVLCLLFALLLVNCSQKPQTLSELKSEYVTVDDSISVHYKIWNESAGSDAKTLCFVHGFGCDMNTWEKQFEAFRDEKGLQIVFIDLPGYGQSDKPHVEYTLDFFAHSIDVWMTPINWVHQCEPYPSSSFSLLTLLRETGMVS